MKTYFQKVGLNTMLAAETGTAVSYQVECMWGFILHKLGWLKSMRLLMIAAMRKFVDCSVIS
jgi:hypothetical protein